MLTLVSGSGEGSGGVLGGEVREGEREAREAPGVERDKEKCQVLGNSNETRLQYN